MATQGLVSVTQGGETIIKIVAGCDGYNASELANKIKAMKQVAVQSAYNTAKKVGFGCDDCLVVVGEDTILYKGEGKLHARYRKTFSDPMFNPRWEHGTADHTEIVEIGG